MISDIIENIKTIEKELKMSTQEALFILLIEELKEIKEVLNEFSNKK
jgi:hypothetical protein